MLSVCKLGGGRSDAATYGALGHVPPVKFYIYVFVDLYTLVCHDHAFFSIVCRRLLQVNDREKFLQL